MMTLVQSAPLCPVGGGLRRVETLRATIDWFLQRARTSEHRKDESVSVCLMKRTEPYDEEVIGREQWRDGELIHSSGRMQLEASDVEVWLEIDRIRNDLMPVIKGTHVDAAMIALIEKARREHYIARDGGEHDRFEIHETRDANERWHMEISIPLTARREQPLARGELSRFDDEWTKPSIEMALENYPLARVLEDTKLKMAEQTYAIAIERAKEMRGPKILELGSNFWPVLPLAVLTLDPAAQFTTLDAHYNGLWVMEKLLEQEAPALLPRVHRHVMDFTDPMPLDNDSFDLALAVASFGPRHEPEDTCGSTLMELHRVLKPGGLFVSNGASFEERSSALLWLFVQRFDVIDQTSCGGHRSITARKRP